MSNRLAGVAPITANTNPRPNSARTRRARRKELCRSKSAYRSCTAKSIDSRFSIPSATSASASGISTTGTVAALAAASISSLPMPLTTRPPGRMITGMMIPLPRSVREMLAAYCFQRPRLALSSGLIGTVRARKHGCDAGSLIGLSGSRSATSATLAPSSCAVKRRGVSQAHRSFVARLNAMLTAFRSARPIGRVVSTGTWQAPNRRATSSRWCPLRISPSLVAYIGKTNPSFRRLSSIRSSRAGSVVRGL